MLTNPICLPVNQYKKRKDAIYCINPFILYVSQFEVTRFHPNKIPTKGKRNVIFSLSTLPDIEAYSYLI